jgi:hypothetical protein
MPNKTAYPQLIRILVLFLLPLGIGCGVLIGNTRPVDEKAKNYSVADLSKAKPEVWKRLPENTGADVAYQSTKTSAVIAVSSSCEAGNRRPASLHSKSNEMFSGMRDITMKRQRELSVAGAPALETTVFGKSPAPVAVRTVVIQRENCWYDLMSSSTQEAYSETSEVFASFLDSFKFH